MLNRRNFVVACMAAGGNAWALGLPESSGVGRSPPANDAAQVIGQLYLDLCPAENQRTALLNLLPAGLLNRQQDGEFALNRTILRAACREDYECGNTVYLDGWQFARTELRLCALTSLLP
jgi:hypothetical protein